MRDFMGAAYVLGEGIPPAEAALIARRQRLLGPAYRLFYERPLHFVAGEGCTLVTADGVRYLDAYNNVPSVGHSHPAVVAAIAAQAARLNTHTRYLHEGILDYAERLLSTMPEAIGNLLFTCTGSEANDLACRVAFAATGGRGLLVTRAAYHGTTALISGLSPSLGPAIRETDTVRFLSPPDAYRGPGDVGAAFAREVERGVAELRAAGVAPAALLVDTAFTSDGNFVSPTGFLAPAAAAIRAAGGLFIADEVQPGFGRTGEAFWGFARHDLVPDLVTMGKPMGNGHPIAAVAARPALVSAFAEQGRYFNTFGGNPVSIAAASAVLDVLRDEGLQENARVVGAHLRERFLALQARHACIGDVRGAGFAFGVELVEDRETRAPAGPRATRLVNRLRDEDHILISVSGPHQCVLKVRPPLCFTVEMADRLVDAVDRLLGDA